MCLAGEEGRVVYSLPEDMERGLYNLRRKNRERCLYSLLEDIDRTPSVCQRI